MKTLKQIELNLVICDREQLDRWKEWEPNTLYYYKDSTDELVAHKCLCGCEASVVIPVNRSDTGWQAIVNSGSLTLIGSILNHGCGVHYVISKNRANIL